MIYHEYNISDDGEKPHTIHVLSDTQPHYCPGKLSLTDSVQSGSPPVRGSNSPGGQFSFVPSFLFTSLCWDYIFVGTEGQNKYLVFYIMELLSDQNFIF